MPQTLMVTEPLRRGAMQWDPVQASTGQIKVSSARKIVVTRKFSTKQVKEEFRWQEKAGATTGFGEKFGRKC